MPIIFQPISWRDAETILTWRYPPPLALYNPPSDYLLWLLDPDNRYHTIIDEAGQLIGFFCLGLDAQVPGGDYHTEEALDVGLGLRPDMIGRGLGTELLRAVLDFARQAFNPPAFRVTVATFNGRAMRMCEKVGFGPSEPLQAQHRRASMNLSNCCAMQQPARIEPRFTARQKLERNLRSRYDRRTKG